MVITEEEANSIKEHLSKQLDNFPEDKRRLIQDKINAMTPEELEIFIEKNNLGHLGGNCIFCSIVSGKTKSFKVGDNAHNIAVLDINPISKGHTLIIPKEHSEETNDYSNKLAQEIGRKINDRFHPKEVKLNKQVIMGHGILEVIPIYGDEGQRQTPSEEELQDIAHEIKKIKVEKPKVEKSVVEKKESIPVLPPRIP
jgi:diadenosine tetraphosphate (Ap4A) HIT family hydrolase